MNKNNKDKRCKCGRPIDSIDKTLIEGQALEKLATKLEKNSPAEHVYWTIATIRNLARILMDGEDVFDKGFVDNDAKTS